MSVNSGESENESDRSNDENSADESEEGSDGSDDSEDSDEASDELPETDVSSGEEPTNLISIKETMDIINGLSRHMDVCKGRLLNRFPVNQNVEEPKIHPEKQPEKTILPQEKEFPQPKTPPRLETPQPTNRVTLFNPYQHSSGQLDETLAAEWASAPHVAEALKILLLDRDDELEESILRHEHSRIIRK